LAKQNRQVLENALKTNRLYKQWMAQKTSSALIIWHVCHEDISVRPRK